MPIVIVVSVAALALMIFKPVLRRLAIRNAVRRPRETALILLGSLLGTAIITGSLIVGDTLTSSIRSGAYTHLGPIDETVSATGAAARDSIERVLAALPRTDIDGTLFLLGTSAAVASGDDGRQRAEPHANVYEVDFDRALAFGADPAATGMSGSTPTGDRAAITQDLARVLGVTVRGSVRILTYGQTKSFSVDRILPRLGVAGLQLGTTLNGSTGTRAANVFVPPGTIAKLAAAAPPGLSAAPPVAIGAVSNRGGVIDGAALTGKVTAQLETALGGTQASVTKTKQDLLDAATRNGKQFTQLFVGIGMFSVIAGLLLLVNIFVMLAQERKTEMGMLRAVGLRRWGLIGSFSLEGWIYALGSSALGTLAGMGVGRAIVLVAARIFSRRDDIFSLNLQYHAENSSIVNGFSIGFLISMVTVIVTSVWISRMNVIRAIRDLPDPVNARQRRLSQVLGALAIVFGLLTTWNGLRHNQAFPVLLGPAMVALGLVPVLQRVISHRLVVSVASIGVIFWSIEAFVLVPKAFNDAAIPVFVEQGLLLVGAAVALVTQNQNTIGALIRRAGGGSRNMSLRLGLAYPLARRFRTGMILTMYALVVFMLTFITVFSHLFQAQVDTFSKKVAGGFDLRVDSNPANPVPAVEVRARPDVAAVATISDAFAEWNAPGVTDGFVRWPAAELSQTYVDRGPTTLSKRGAYPTDAAAYAALQSSEDLLIPATFFLQSGNGGPPKRSLQPGDTVTIRDPRSGRTRVLHVAAIAESGFGNLYGYVSPAAMKAVFGDRLAPNLLYVAVKPGVAAEGVVASINGRYIANGADSKTFKGFIQENLGQQLQFFRLMRGYLALGLLVGIAGLGVVMVRAVRERRRQVGVLRSLGFSAVAVRRAFVAESAFIALEGIGIGASLALVTAWRLTGAKNFGASFSFSIPVGALVVLIIGTFIASMLATATPAQQASRIKPAVALRMTD